MSLTSNLNDPSSPIGQFIKQKFSQTKNITKIANPKLRGEVTISPGFPSLVYSHIGMAIDYRFRYSFAITPKEQLIAWTGSTELCTKLRENENDIPFDWEDVPRGMTLSTPVPAAANQSFFDLAVGPYPLKLVLSFFDSLDATLRTIAPVGRKLEAEDERLLARYCFVLGLFEEPYRSDRYLEGPLMLPAPRTSVDELLHIAEDAWIDDLCQLSTLFYDKCHHLLSQPFVLNPTFKGSSDVGGADADLIVDGCLIEVKSSIGARIDAKWLYQLAGYTLLDYDDKYHLNSVGIYMARQGLLLKWPIDEFLYLLSGSNNLPLAQYRKEFIAFCRGLQSVRSR